MFKRNVHFVPDVLHYILFYQDFPKEKYANTFRRRIINYETGYRGSSECRKEYTF